MHSPILCVKIALYRLIIFFPVLIVKQSFSQIFPRLLFLCIILFLHGVGVKGDYPLSEEICYRADRPAYLLPSSPYTTLYLHIQLFDAEVRKETFFLKGLGDSIRFGLWSMSSLLQLPTLSL